MAALDLHPECKKLDDFLKANATDRSNLTLGQIRDGHNQVSKLFNGGCDNPFEGEKREIFIPSADVKDGIPTYVYKPKSLKPDPVIYVYFHGGGMVLGTRDGYDGACKVIASAAGCIVLNVEYRLAPEHKCPAQMDDAIVVMNWVKENKVKLGGTEKSKVGIGGDSAGGTISASVAHDVPLDFQVLVYPHVTKGRDHNTLESMVKYVDGPLLTVEYIKWFENHFLPIGEELNPRIASIYRPKFDHLPPAIVLIAEHDPLYTGSWLYAKKLEENGVSVETHEYKGAIHGFYGALAFCPTLNEAANSKIAEFINKIHAK